MKPSTIKRGRPNQQVGALKVLLVTGSVIATWAGTQLLPLQDAARVEAPVFTSKPARIVVPAPDAAFTLLPPGERRRQVELNPIAQAVQPQIRPVARSRSSR